jgi:hypothetical protein
MAPVSIESIREKLSNPDYTRRLNEQGLELSPTTVRDYIAKMKTLSGRLEERDIAHMLENCHRVIDYIENFQTRNGQPYATATKKAYFTAICSMCRYKIVEVSDECLRAYEMHMKEHADQLAENAARNDDSPQTRGLTWADVMEGHEKLHREDPASMDDLMLAMYTMIPPRRLIDYRNMRVYRRVENQAERTGNYIVVHENGKAEMTINEHKTSKRYGPYRTTLPRALGKLIVESLKKMPREKLIVNPESRQVFGNATSDDGSMSRYLTTVTNRAIGRSIGIIALRRLFVTSLDMRNMDVAELRRIAYEMGHSTEMQMQYRIVRHEDLDGVDSGDDEAGPSNRAGRAAVPHSDEAGPSNRARRAAVPHSDEAGPSDPRPRTTALSPNPPVTPGAWNTVVRVTSALRAVPQHTASDEALPAMQPPQVVVVPQEVAQVVHAPAASPAASTAASSHQPSQRSYSIPPFGQIEEFEAHSAPHAQVVVVQPVVAAEPAEPVEHAAAQPPFVHAAAQPQAHAEAADAAGRKRRIAELIGDMFELFPGTEVTFKLKL